MKSDKLRMKTEIYALERELESMGSYYNYMLTESRKADMEQKIENQKRNAKRWIWVTFQKEGIHKYRAALEDPALATGDEYDVSFLGYPHRHKFHFRVAISVTHNDRDIEFIQFQRWLENLYKEDVIQLDYKSCEMMSDDLFDQISAKYQT